MKGSPLPSCILKMFCFKDDCWSFFNLRIQSLRLTTDNSWYSTLVIFQRDFFIMWLFILSKVQKKHDLKSSSPCDFYQAIFTRN